MPQFALSVMSARHEPEQFVSPAPHEVWHVPAEHTVPDGQTVPHPPQLASSVCVSRQVPPQFVRPV
jgi:hypothetical protein